MQEKVILLEWYDAIRYIYVLDERLQYYNHKFMLDEMCLLSRIFRGDFNFAYFRGWGFSAKLKQTQ